MTRPDADTLIHDLLLGARSHLAQGFLCTLPKGATYEGRFDRHLAAAYGSSLNPDIRCISPSGAGGLITVDAIRDAAGFLASKPSGPGMKTLVVLRADRMNEAAANALLKPLEEPTAQTRILLATDAPGRLLPTIRSRCIVVPFRSTRADMLSELSDMSRSAGVEITEAQMNDLLDLADENPSLALSLIEQDLVAWLRSLPAWLTGLREKRSPAPLPKGIGTKSGPALLPAALGLQAVLARNARGDAHALPIHGWPPGRLHAACWRLMPFMTDIDRAGIDARTRMHVLLDTIADTPA